MESLIIQQLQEENRQLREENRQLKETIQKLMGHVRELERRINLNSANSSKPPSSDGLNKKNRTKSLREKSERSSGGQKGHEGKTLKAVTHPDVVVVHPLVLCPKCQSSLEEVPIKTIHKRQVFDIPQPQVIVTEHQIEEKRCPCCGMQVKAHFPTDVTAPVQYGKRIKSVACYLQHQQFMPTDRLQQTMEDLFGVFSVSEATLQSFNRDLDVRTQGFEQKVIENVKESKVKHLDETGCPIRGKGHWIHVISTKLFTWYRVSKSRKNLPEGLMGTVVHDHYKPYFQLNNPHALCNTHHLRELKAVAEIDGEEWAKDMKKLLGIGSQLKKRHPKEIPQIIIRRFQKIYDAIIEKGLAFHMGQVPLPQKGRGRKKKRIGHNLVMRLRNYSVETLRFLTEPEVPFTNNQAERDLRMVKLKEKISGGFRTMKGAEVFCRIRGFLSTIRKIGWNVIQSIEQVFQGKALELKDT